MLIDYAGRLRQRKAFLREYGYDARTTAAVKKRKQFAFERNEEELRRMEKRGRALFPQFCERTLARGRAIEKRKQKEAQQKEMLRNAASWKINLELRGGSVFEASMKQISYLSSLTEGAAAQGYLLPDNLKISSLNMLQASCLIAILKKVKENLPALDSPKIISNLDEVFARAKEREYGILMVELKFAPTVETGKPVRQKGKLAPVTGTVPD